MKKIKIIVFLFLASTMFIACGGSDDTEGGSNNSTSDKIIGNWKAIGSQDASGVFTAGPSCIVVFQKFSANGDFKLTYDYSGICGQDSGVETGSWVKVANSQEYTVTLANGNEDTLVLTFFENNTKFSFLDFEGVAQVFQKQ
jgi:hypothetical protein